MAWSPANTNDEGHNQEPNNRDDLDTCKNKFGLAIDGHGENVEEDDENDEDGDPYGDVDTRVPEIDDDGCGCDFGTASDRVRIPILPDY